jgi:ribosomal protein L40E
VHLSRWWAIQRTANPDALREPLVVEAAGLRLACSALADARVIQAGLARCSSRRGWPATQCRPFLLSRRLRPYRFS